LLGQCGCFADIQYTKGFASKTAFVLSAIGCHTREQQRFHGHIDLDAVHNTHHPTDSGIRDGGMGVSVYVA